jgi:hypothetical protein
MSPPPPDLRKMGRIALRHEGEFWNAYYAMPGTMEGALLLGSLHMRFATDRRRKEAFMDLIRDCVGDILQQKIGRRPAWNEPEPAPEHERSGSA